MEGSKELLLAVHAAKTAGAIIRTSYGKVQQITNKGVNDIVTETDKRAEKSIIDILQQGTSWAIMSEEAGNISGARDACWVIDPLDGTTNFSRGFPLFGVSIALIQDNSFQLGVVFNPMNDEIFYAEKGKGAYLNEERIVVSGQERTAVFILDGGDQKAEHTDAYAKATEILKNDFLLRRLGTVALELCYVAKGAYDGFADYGDMLWDCAAGLCIVEEAGGKISDWKGNPPKMEHRQHILATNGKIHDQITRKISYLQK